MTIKTVLCFLAILYVIDSKGQDFTTINYSVANGLPTSEVYDVFQDSQGLLWFATDNGVIRFDGSEFQKFGVVNGLTDPVVFECFEDTKGRIWFRTFSGKLCFFYEGKIEQYQYNSRLLPSTSPGDIRFFFDAAKNELLFTQAHYFGKIDSTGLLAKQEFKGKGIYVENINGKLLHGVNFDSLNSTKAVTINGKYFPIRDPDPSMFHRRINLLQHNGKVYIPVKNEIYEFDGTNLKKVLAGRGSIICLSKDKHNNFWVGYLHHGVERFKAGDFTRGWTPEFLQDNSVTRVLEDHEGGLWFTTLENGVTYVPNLQIKNTQIQLAGKLRSVLPLKNSFIAGDEVGNIYTFDTAQNKLILKKSLGSPVLSSFHDNQNKYWIACFGSIHVFDDDLNEIRHVDDNTVNDFFEDAQGKLWCYSGHRLKHFDYDGNLIFAKAFRKNSRAIFVDDSLVCLAGRIGLDLKDHFFEPIQSPPVLSNKKIVDIISLTDSTILICTVGSGFLIMNKHTLHIREFNSKNQFIADNIYCVQKSGTTVWLGTERGIAKTSVGSLHKVNPSFDYLTQNSGLISDRINFLIAKPEVLLAFSDNGFSQIPLPIQQFANKTPGFYIKTIAVNQIAKNVLALINLRHNQNNIHIEFGHRSFNNPVVFTRYKLADQDAWNYTPNKSIQLNALAPGTYRLRLQNSTDNIRWIEAEGIPVITILPPWWQTWYFYTVAIFIVGALIYFYFRHQINTYSKHQLKLIQSELEAIEQERARIAKELHDSVGTDFSAIKMMVSHALQKYNDPKSEEIETEFQSTIQDIKSIIYGLSPPGLDRYGLMAALKNYIDKLNGTIPATIQLKSFGPEIKNLHVKTNIFRIIQELISNSLKHSKANTITLHINSFEDLVNIIYEDDGTGFTLQQQGNGLGLYNIESRIRSLNGQVHFESGEYGVSYTIDIPQRTLTDDAPGADTGLGSIGND